MSQMAAMKCRNFYKKRLTAQEIMVYLPIVAFPLFLQTHYNSLQKHSGSLKKKSCFILIFISWGKGTLFGPVFHIFEKTHLCCRFWLSSVDMDQTNFLACIFTLRDPMYCILAHVWLYHIHCTTQFAATFSS